MADTEIPQSAEEALEVIDGMLEGTAAPSAGLYKFVSVEDIIEAADLATDVVEVPEWGGFVEVRSFSKDEQMKMRAEATGPDGTIDNSKLELLMFIHGVTQPQLSAEHAGIIRSKNAGVVDRVLKRILVISGISEKAVEQAEATFPSGS